MDLNPSDLSIQVNDNSKLNEMSGMIQRSGSSAYMLNQQQE